MVMHLVNPAWLWGLLGLLVPIAIHLLHKRSRRVLKVGSLQPFRGGEPVQARSVRLSEIGLLLLRCLLLVLFVLLLAQPVLYKQEQSQKKYVFLAHELATAASIDSLQAAGFEPRYLQPGLAGAEENTPADSSHLSYWDVFKEIDALEDAGDTVWLLFNPTMDRFRGNRPHLSKTFVALPTKAQQNDRQLSNALQLQKKVLLQWWEPKGEAWQISSETMPLEAAKKQLSEVNETRQLQHPDTLNIVLHARTEEQGERLMWLQALQLIDSALLGHAFIIKTMSSPEQELPLQPDVLIWMSAADPPAAFTQNDELLRLQYKKGGGSRWFERDLSDSRLYHIRHKLHEEQNNRMLLANFIPELLEVLPLAKASATPEIVLPASQWQGQAAQKMAAVSREISYSLELWLWALLVLVFILERWLSLRK